MIVSSSSKTNRILYLPGQIIQTFYLKNELGLGAFETDRPTGRLAPRNSILTKSGQWWKSKWNYFSECPNQTHGKG